MVARKLVEARVPFVTLSGGEPLLAPHWSEVAGILADGGATVALATNGSRLSREADRVVEAGVRIVTVSLDALSPGEHDASRHHPGLHEALVTGLDALRTADPEGRVRTRLRVTLGPGNVDAMTEIARSWRPRVDEVSFQPLQDLGPDDVHHGPGAVPFPPEAEGSFRRSMDRLRRTYPEFATPYYERMADFLFRPDETRDTFHCLVPALAFKIRADGSGASCADGRTSLGDAVPRAPPGALDPPGALRSPPREPGPRPALLLLGSDDDRQRPRPRDRPGADPLTLRGTGDRG